MKTSLSICTILVLLSLVSYQKAKAQIWKKIKKKTQEKVEQTVSNKVSDKAAEMAANNMDKILNADINPFGKGGKREDISDLPKRYSFEWKYELQMQAQVKGDQKKMDIDYYISPGNPYFGFSMPQMPSMFTVMDSNQHVMIAYMEQGDQPIAMAYNLPETEANTDADSANNLKDYTVTKLPDKNFLGYNCQGLQLENNHHRVILYYTTEAGISFSQAAKSDKARIPTQLKKYISGQSKGLMTYMKFIDKNNPKQTVTMKGISLDKTMLVKSNRNYKFM